MKVFSNNPSIGYYVGENIDAINVQNVNASGTTWQTAAPIKCNSGLTIAICRRVNSSNYSVLLDNQSSYQSPSNQVSFPPQLASAVEVYAENGPITVFLTFGASFLDGTTSKVVSSGTRFTFVQGSNGGPIWAYLD